MSFLQPMCNPSEISLFANDLSRRQLWPEARVTFREKKKEEKHKFRSQVGFAGGVIEKDILFVNKGVSGNELTHNDHKCHQCHCKSFLLTGHISANFTVLGN